MEFFLFIIIGISVVSVFVSLFGKTQSGNKIDFNKLQLLKEGQSNIHDATNAFGQPTQILKTASGTTILHWGYAAQQGIVGSEWAHLNLEFDANNILVALPVIPAISSTPSSSGERKCPFCAELVKREALICKHCQRDLPPEPEAPMVTPAPLTPNQLLCPRCNSAVKDEAVECWACGKGIRTI